MSRLLSAGLAWARPRSPGPGGPSELPGGEEGALEAGASVGRPGSRELI